MKRCTPLFHSIFVIALLAAAVGCSSKSFTVTCDLSPILAQYDGGTVIDSILVQYMAPNGEYATLGRAEVTGNVARYSGIIQEPTIGKMRFFLTVPGGSGSSECNLILEPGDITADEKFSFHGSQGNDAVHAALDQLALCANDPQAVQDLVDEFQRKNDDVATAYFFSKTIPQLGLERWAETLGSMGDGVQNHPYIQKFSESVNRALVGQEAMSPGARYRDFQGTWEGKEYKLSDFVNQGKYVLVDFWASWCNPCRKEIPNIIRTYNKYKDKGLEVIGVAVSDKPEDTAKAVKELGINYTVFNETDGSASNAYGIQSIPQILLFGPDGTILATGMRGEEIEQSVKRALK